MNDNPQESEGAEETPIKRRPYSKPQVISDKAFETMALSCGSSGIACIAAPPNS